MRLGERRELSTTAPHHHTFTAQQERQRWCSVEAARPSSTPLAHAQLSTAGHTPGNAMQWSRGRHTCCTKCACQVFVSPMQGGGAQMNVCPPTAAAHPSPWPPGASHGMWHAVGAHPAVHVSTCAKAPWGGGGGGRGGSGRGWFWEGCRRGWFPGGGGGRAPPNTWVCSLGVIQQFEPPLPTIEGRVSSAWVFPATRGTSRGWAPEAVIRLELHHATRHTYIQTNIYIHIYIYIYTLLSTPLSPTLGGSTIRL